MTVNEARKAISEPLRFGDPNQIAAIKFLQEVQGCVEHLMECSDCRTQQWLGCDHDSTASVEVWEAAYEEYNKA